MSYKKRKETSNKGFSLVELIVVISIMAILLGVLGPSYMRFVEKSRESYDLNNYDIIVNGIKINGTDVGSTQITDCTIKFNTLGAVETIANTKTALKQYGIDLDEFKSKSKKYGNVKFTIKIAASGLPDITVDNADVAAALQLDLTTP